ncbi:MAG: hypothetical protein H6705_18180 [Myxococcales bacterium]|nr:hypothetical protein [Myxococcales bacterium]
MRFASHSRRATAWVLAVVAMAGCTPAGGGGGGDDDAAVTVDGALDPADAAADGMAGDAMPGDGAVPPPDAAPADGGQPDRDVPMPDASRADAAPDPDAAPPGCAGDDDCADPLAESCAAGVCAPNPCGVVVFEFDPQGAAYDDVHVAGSFNGWPADRGAGLQLDFDPERGRWAGKGTLGEGRHAYKFVTWRPGAAEPVWVQDPMNPDGEDDGFGGQNSVLSIDCPDCARDADCGGGARCIGGVCAVSGCAGDDDCDGGAVCFAGRCEATVVCDDAFDWRDAVMYFAMVDRFSDGDGRAEPVEGAQGGPDDGPNAQYAGGDLVGLTEKLPYLADLGVTALWITAPFENRDRSGEAIDPGADPRRYSAYHGYWPAPADVRFVDGEAMPEPRVESRIGDGDDLHALVEGAHAAASADGDGIKVLFDYVMNHVDIDSGLYRAHPEWFARVTPGGQFTTEPGPQNRFRLCPETEWDGDRQVQLWNHSFWGTRCAFTPYLPPFAFDEAPAALQWSVEDALWWAATYGIDGYRLDAIKHVPLPWLIALRSRLDRALGAPAGDRFYLVGETFDYDDRGLLARFVEPGRMLDGQFDFPFKARLCEALFRPEGDLGGFAAWMDGNDGFYGDDAIMTTWIGNHDIPRAIHYASGQIANCREGSHPGNGWTNDYRQPQDAAPYERLGLAFAVMMTNPGIPLIYYGDEIGLAGGGDPDNRRMMPWDDAQLSAAQRALRSRVRALSRLRARYPSLGRGRRVTMPGTGRDVWVYARLGCAGDPPLMVVINRADEARAVELPAGRYVDLLAEQAPVAGGARELAPRSVMVLRPAAGGR